MTQQIATRGASGALSVPAMTPHDPVDILTRIVSSIENLITADVMAAEDAAAA